MEATQIRSRWANSLSQWAKTARHPPKYLTASLLVCLGGLLNGLDTSVIGPVTVMPSFIDTFGNFSATTHGLIVSSVCLPGALTSMFAGNISDSLGRTRAIAIGGLVFAVGAALEAASVSLGMLIGGRCIVGLGQGIFLSSLCVYVCEISPPQWRGPLATMVQLFITLGLVVGYFTTYGTVGIPSSLSWRLPLALQAGVAVILAIAAAFFLPPSPRWLAFKGRNAEAIAVWEGLGVSSAEREKDLLEQPVPVPDADAQRLLAESAEAKKSIFESIRGKMFNSIALFDKDARKPLLLGVFLMSMQQMSGIDGVIYYAPLLFEQAGLTSSEAAFLASGVSAILIFVFTILAVIFVDRWGRRASTIYGGLVLLACMALMGTLYASNSVHSDTGVGRWLVIISIYVFAIGYSMTWAFGLKIFASEIQPRNTRAAAVSIAQGANFLTNFFIAFITPILLDQSTYGAYFLFAGCLLITVLVSMVYMPETRGQDLEAVREAFADHKFNVGDVRVVKLGKSLTSWIVGRANRGGWWRTASPSHPSSENGSQYELEVPRIRLEHMPTVKARGAPPGDAAGLRVM